jgi:23S rRNA pseudouridine1911/1915/1917 synthase
MLNSYAKRHLLTGWQFMGFIIFVTMSYHVQTTLSERILYEDNHLIVINKMVGEIVQGDITGDTPLSEAIKAFLKVRDAKPGNVFLGVPHRLDRPVSGICLFAKTSKALERMNKMFNQGTVSKTYLALVANKPAQDEALLVHYLTRNEKQNKSYALDEPEQGAKEARLRYKYLKSIRNYHLLEIELLTGRHHQIRCQLAAMGSPIKGDLKYGASRPNQDGGISLHAFRLAFVHPVTREPVVFVSPWSVFGKKVTDSQ